MARLKALETNVSNLRGCFANTLIDPTELHREPKRDEGTDR